MRIVTSTSSAFWSLFLFLPLVEASPSPSLPTVTSETPPECKCPRLFKPVCGSDGVTYNNQCKLGCRQLEVKGLRAVYAGTCCPKDNCPYYNEPVCDSRGRTHVNECVFHHIRCLLQRTQGIIIRIQERNECGKNSTSAEEDEEEEEDCTRKWRNCLNDSGGPPVCDEHGVTHRSVCAFETWNCDRRKAGRQELRIVSQGSCPVADTSTALPSFVVVDSNMRGDLAEESASREAEILRNQHQRTNEIRKKEPLTETQTSTPLPHFVPRAPLQFADVKNITVEADIDDEELGGVENSTLKDIFELIPFEEVTRTTRKPFVGQGTIEEDVEAQAQLLKGVSFSSGVGGPQRNNLEIKPSIAFRDPRPQGSTAQVVESTGRPCSAAQCDKAWKPVCDSRGKTHKNACLFRFHACRLLRTQGIEVTMAREGPCESSGSLIVPLIVTTTASSVPPSTTAFLLITESDSGNDDVNGYDGAIAGDSTTTTIARAPSTENKDARCGDCATETEKIPVCDNLNKTHSSICRLALFNCHEVANGRDIRILVHIGKCRATSPVFTLQEEVCPLQCSHDYKPVCDESGVTHPNLCSFQMFHCEQRKRQHRVASLAYLTECKTATEAEPQTTVVVTQTVTTEATTWTSESAATQSSSSSSVAPSPSTSTSAFECPEPLCGLEKSPVCDSEGAVHKNECLFNWARCLAAQQGRTLSIMPDEACQLGACQANCTGATYDPICGSDFLTYPSMCHLLKEQCKHGDIEILFRGECDECFQKPCRALDDSEPDDLFVCLEETGETKSRCEFSQLRCVYEKKLGAELSYAYPGRCCPSRETCFTINDPVCGSDRTTYRNRCFFEIARCKAGKIGRQLNIMGMGRCPSEFFSAHTRGVDKFALSAVPREEFKDEASVNSSVEERSEEGGSNSSSPSCSSEECPSLYEPVCGTNGKTYTNTCQLKKEKCFAKDKDLRENYKGECCPSDCPKNWNPVCDSKGQTHQNLCEFGRNRCEADRRKRENLTIVKYDVCGGADCSEACPKDYNPETFVNECELNKLNCLIEKKLASGNRIHIAYSGECCPSHQCAYEFSPVCDSEGRTHANDCIYRHTACVEQRRHNKTTKIAYKGQCCNQPCEDTDEPVCDGQRTHKNMCTFRVAQCEAERVGNVLSIAYAGSCCELSINQNCSRSGVLCDSEGQTHQTACHLLHKQCVRSKAHPGHTLSVIHAGECCLLEQCSNAVEPVCDSLGRTHRSACHFRNTKCIQDKINSNNTMYLAYPGRCCTSDCETTWQPVCDQHGSVYKNKCYFRLKSCELDRRGGSVLLETPCPERRARHLSLRTTALGTLFQRLKVPIP